MKKIGICTLSFVAAAFVGLISCKDWEDNELKGTIPVAIEDLLVPDTSPAGQEAEILVYVEAPNGCFSDLKVTLLRLQGQNYLLRATGYYDSEGVCTAVPPSLDTLIAFDPPSTGTYYFQANEDPLPILRDTLTVN